MLLGRTGKFNPETQAWNSACSDPKFTAMLAISYLSVIGNPYKITIYARDPTGNYHYLGLLPSSDPIVPNVKFTTPSGILNPTTSHLNSDIAAGQQMFSVNPGSDQLQLITSFEMNFTEVTGGQSLSAQCVEANNTASNITDCVNGMLNSGNATATNPLLKATDGTNRTLEIQYDIAIEDSPIENSTFLVGYAGTWPSEDTNFLEALLSGVGVDGPPYGQMAEINSEGIKVNAEGVQVISSPWPGCGGLKVCGTSGLNALAAAGWIWENLEKWEWYNAEDCAL
jgi:hypothetical protein